LPCRRWALAANKRIDEQAIKFAEADYSASLLPHS